MIVEGWQTAHAQARPRFVEFDIHGFVRHPNHPEHVVRVDVHIVVVDLVREVGRSDRTGVDVKSNKGKRTLMVSAVRADELALAETHVRLESEGRAHARQSVCAGPAAADMRQAHEPVEVRDLGRIVEVG